MLQYYLLTDLAEETTDAVIVSTTSTVENIENAISAMKAQREGEWQWDDLVACLPDDCTLVADIWGDLKKVYY